VEGGRWKLDLAKLGKKFLHDIVNKQELSYRWRVGSPTGSTSD